MSDSARAGLKRRFLQQLSPPADRRFRPLRLERLEDRLALATFNPLAAAVDGTPNSLRAAITIANGNNQNDTIKLQAGTYTLSLANVAGQENLNATGDLDLRESGKSITIQGVGANATFIDGNFIDRVLHVFPGVNVVLRKLTIRNGFAQDDGTAATLPDQSEARGGGILIESANVRLEEVLVINNGTEAANGTAGALGSDGGNALFNAAGGGIYASLDATSTLRLLANTAIVDNRAVGGKGGNGGDADSLLNVGNGASGSDGFGGGVFVTGGALVVSNSTIMRNLASGGLAGFGGNSGAGPGGDGGDSGDATGGGLFVAASAVTVEQSTIADNVANVQGGGASGSGSVGGAGGQTGEASGGGLFASGGTLAITGSQMRQNRASANLAGGGGDGTAQGGNGATGGPARGGGMLLTGVAANVTDSTLAGNSALGGIGGRGGGGPLTGVAGTGGEATGGAVTVFAGRVSFISTILSDNSALGGVGGEGGTGGGAGGAGQSARGGAVFASADAAVAFSGSTLRGNAAVGGTGGLGDESGATAGGDGGAAAAGLGGGVFATSATLIVGNSQIQLNRAQGGAGGAGDIGNGVSGDGGAGGLGLGGGLFVQNGATLVSASTLAGNAALGGKGGNGGLSIGAGEIGGNGGVGGAAEGGAIFESGQLAILSNSTISGNTTRGGNGGDGGDGFGGADGGNGGDAGASRGGGLFAFGLDLQLRSATIAANTAADSEGGSLGAGVNAGQPGQSQLGDGGGVFQLGGPVVATSTLFADNVATQGDDFFGTVLATFSLFEIVDSTTFDAASSDNITGVDPLLAPLANNGGPTETHALISGSPALDTGANPGNTAFDQRGANFHRHSGPSADIGAFELQLPSGPQLLFDALTLGLVISIEGTSGKDKIVVKNASGGRVKVEFNGKHFYFDAAGVVRIVAFGRKNKDEIRLESNVNIPAILDGGEDNDVLKGGAAADILLGQHGADDLFGLGGRDILIGGTGQDDLYGGNGDDLLIGGLTLYDNNHVALRDIQVKWTSVDPYAVRVADLQSGTGTPQLSTTQISDTHEDRLHGNADLDLFFQGVGDDTDRGGVEISISIL